MPSRACKACAVDHAEGKPSTAILKGLAVMFVILSGHYE